MSEESAESVKSKAKARDLLVITITRNSVPLIFDPWNYKFVSNRSLIRSAIQIMEIPLPCIVVSITTQLVIAFQLLANALRPTIGQICGKQFVCNSYTRVLIFFGKFFQRCLPFRLSHCSNDWMFYCLHNSFKLFWITHWIGNTEIEIYFSIYSIYIFTQFYGHK